MLDRGVPLRLQVELGFLELGVGGHPALRVPLGQLEHGEVDRVEAGERHELELVSHLPDGGLEVRDLLGLELLAPVERGRAVVGEELPGELLVDLAGEALGLVDVRGGGLEPEQVRVGGVGLAPGDDHVEPARDAVVPLLGPAPGHEGLVPGIDVAREELGGERVGPGDDDRRDPEDVRGEPRGPELLVELPDGHQDLASHVAALLGGGELVLDVDGGGAGLDERLRELEGVEDAPEPRLGVGDDGGEPVGVPLAGRVLLLVLPSEGVVDPPDQGGHGVRRVEALVRVGLRRAVRIGGHLPAARVDGLEARGDHLHGLAAVQGPEGRNVRLAVEEAPEALRPEGGKGVPDVDRTPQPLHVLGSVGPQDALPSLAGLPVFHRVLPRLHPRLHPQLHLPAFSGKGEQGNELVQALPGEALGKDAGGALGLGGLLVAPGLR